MQKIDPISQIIYMTKKFLSSGVLHSSKIEKFFSNAIMFLNYFCYIICLENELMQSHSNSLFPLYSMGFLRATVFVSRCLCLLYTKVFVPFVIKIVFSLKKIYLNFLW